MIGHVSSRLRPLPVSLARHWLQTLIVSVLAVFTASYFHFTGVHALESIDAGSCTPLAAGDLGQCVSSLQALLDDNRPYPGITVGGYFGAQTQQAVIDFQSAHNLAGDGVVAPTETLLAQAHGWAAKFLCIILIALIAALLDLLTEVFRAVSGRPAFGDPPSQETQPQMRAGYGS